MNPLLEQFILEARDFLQAIGEKLIAMERVADDEAQASALINELFRLVHTLKGNSGLFDFPEMTRVLHAGEDLMDAVRDGRLAFSRELADRLLDAMDFVGALLDEVAQDGQIHHDNIAPSEELARSLRALIPAAEAEAATPPPAASSDRSAIALPELASIPETARMAAWRAAAEGRPLFLLGYRPDEECFFKGEDPLYQVRHLPGLLWADARPRQSWPPLAELDCYRCVIDFQCLAAAPRAELEEYFRYTPEQVRLQAIEPLALIIPIGGQNGGPVYHDFVAEALALLEAGDLAGLDAFSQTLLELSAPELWLASAVRWLRTVLQTTPERRDVMRRLIEALDTLETPTWHELAAPAATPAPQSPAPTPQATAQPLTDAERQSILDILATQARILALPEGDAAARGRFEAAAASIRACLDALGVPTEGMEAAWQTARQSGAAAPLAQWLDAFLEDRQAQIASEADEPRADETQPAGHGVATVDAPAVTPSPSPSAAPQTPAPSAPPAATPPASSAPSAATTAGDGEARFGRRAEDSQKILKVDQAKIDRLMNLIGEMVVAKNALPYLANRADNQYGVRELAREIKAQYAVINRIAEEMQDAIMQVRMMPVSFIFQRFPRLVRDISRKLGKEVELKLEGEETEADKNIIEALADPMIHIVRNSLDHGLETPEARLAAGKPATGLLHIRASQESDRVIIEVRDDGRGIDPKVIKRKAWEKGLIDEAQLERLSDQEAINLVFLPGFSTAEAITDLSGRGVGMDVVRNAIDKVNGTVELASTVGQGTRLRLSLPLSMAVTNVMIVESDRQIFGVPMALIVETVRLPRASIRTIKRQKTAVLRGKIVPLIALNDLLAIPAEPKANGDDELAALVVRVGRDQVGLLVDDFREVVDVILKPLPGELARLTCYAGTALLGDGSVLMVLNPKELF